MKRFDIDGMDYINGIYCNYADAEGIINKFKWISIEDRLPERVLVDGFETKSILVYSENGFIQMQTCSQLHDTLKDKDDYYYKIYTHWMELPEAPIK